MEKGERELGVGKAKSLLGKGKSECKGPEVGNVHVWTDRLVNKRKKSWDRVSEEEKVIGMKAQRAFYMVVKTLIFPLHCTVSHWLLTEKDMIYDRDS